MTSSKSYFRIIIKTLLVVFFLGGCATYQGSYTLPEALQANRDKNRKVMITTVDNDKIEYQKIDMRDGEWVGQKVQNAGRSGFEPISPEAISKIEVERSTQTAANEGGSVLAILGVIVLIPLLIAAAI
ncbi:MAG: hypothetical protein HKO94_00605 [Flavobacteriaceae bacterium]|nr:hypothetical protein [Flavobacteriaceae bacterium]